MWRKDDLFFKALEKCIGEFYVIEEESKKLVYINSPDVKQNTEQFYNEKCFSALHARKSQCAFCPKSIDIVDTSKMDGCIETENGFSTSQTIDSYVASDKKWYQYKMTSYTANNKKYRIIIRCEVENMMGLSSLALGMMSDYKNSYENTSEMQKKMAYEITHDGMTDLYNKGKYLFDVANIEIKKEAVGIIVCDLNDLKSINDTFGHMVGDEIIRVIATVLKKVKNKNTKCYRIGGDEFAIIQNNSNEGSIEQVTKAITEMVSKYHDDRVALAMGCAVWYPGESFDNVFHRADEKMYENKAKMKK